MKKEVMITAWEIAREAVVEFGGKVVEYLSEALKMAWAKIKGEKIMKELKGSEKQVVWAEDIRRGYLQATSELKELQTLSIDGELELEEANRKLSLETITGLSQEFKTLKSENRASLREIKKEKDLEREEKRALNKKFRNELKKAEMQAIENSIEKSLQEENASFWIEKFKHLANFGK